MLQSTQQLITSAETGLARTCPAVNHRCTHVGTDEQCSVVEVFAAELELRRTEVALVGGMQHLG